MKLFATVCLVVCLSLQASSDDRSSEEGFGDDRCRACSSLSIDQGFRQTNALSLALFQQVSTCTPLQCSTDQIVVESGRSPGNDDAPANAICPIGFTVVGCRCELETANACDGVQISQRVCTSFNGGVNPAGNRAIAICTPEPPNRYFIVLNPTVDFTQNPVSTCPPDSDLVNCFVNNPWMRFKLITTVLDGNSCRVSSPCDNTGRGCRLQALCRRR